MVEYRAVLPPYDEPFIAELHHLCAHVFGNNNRDNLVWKLTQMPDVSVHLAQQGQLVGFKIGYALARERYYSWLGGVHEDCRRQGIGLNLMERQHQRLQSRGFNSVETNTPYTNVAMIALNHRAGFHIVGTYIKNNLQRVIMAKEL